MATRVASARHKIARILPATTYKVKGFPAIATRWGLALALAEIDWLGKNAECQKNLGAQRAVKGSSVQFGTQTKVSPCGAQMGVGVSHCSLHAPQLSGVS